MTATEGSLCTGYDGLGMAVAETLGTETAWVSEVDPTACAVIDARLPGVPNLGDLTAVDWATVPPVDVLTAGYPCQPFSTAGRRQGANDERHLWPHIADAIGVLRPELVVLENVAGHLSLGFDVVLADLARLGYDARWTVVRASDVGACHRRARLFVLAYASGVGEPHEPESDDAQPLPLGTVAGAGHRVGAGDHAPGIAVNGGGASILAPTHPYDRTSDGKRSRPESGQGGGASADAEHVGLNGRAERPGTSQGANQGWVLQPEGRNPADAPDPTDIRRQRAGDARRRGDGPADGGGSPADTHQAGSQGAQPAPRRDVPDWGAYGPAIVRHATAIGRPAPNPVDSRGRLNPVFVEWMMMLPAGWVTDVVTTRSQALKCLGNGVVPPQAAYALRWLLSVPMERAA